MTKREALVWEQDFRESFDRNLNIPLSDFVERYLADIRLRLKPTSMNTKISIINRMVLPYFAGCNISEITPADIISYVNDIRSSKLCRGGSISDGYVRAAWQTLKAIFSHAYKFYALRNNPCQRMSARDIMRSAPLQDKKPDEKKKFWELREYETFITALKMSGEALCFICAFELLYFCGLRVGELIALSASDFDLDNRNLAIKKNLQHVSGKNLILSPKTSTSIRTIELPDFLSDEINEYVEGLQPMDKDARLFPFCAGTLRARLAAGAKAAGLKPINVHGFRHSHVSLLTSFGLSHEQIAYRLGLLGSEINDQKASD